MTPIVSWKLGVGANLSFSCLDCGMHNIFFGDCESPYMQGVIDGLLLEHAGHDFIMVEYPGLKKDERWISKP